MSEGYIDKGARISADGKYRYRLWREWRNHPNPSLWNWWKDHDGSPVLDGGGHAIGEPLACVFIMLNPSTADGDDDDPTIRRCVGFAKSWQFDRLEVVNLFAYRATDPQALLRLDHSDDPVGVGNQDAVRRAIDGAGIIVCAWGAHGGHLGQDETMLGWLGSRKVGALGFTKNGHPKHPLYVRADQNLSEFSGRRTALQGAKP